AETRSEYLRQDAGPLRSILDLDSTDAGQPVRVIQRASVRCESQRKVLVNLVRYLPDPFPGAPVPEGNLAVPPLEGNGHGEDSSVRTEASVQDGPPVLIQPRFDNVIGAPVDGDPARFEILGRIVF